MFKCFFLPSLFFGFPFVNLGAFDFDENSLTNTGGVEQEEIISKENEKKSVCEGNTYNKESNKEKKENDISEIKDDKNINSAGVNPDLQPASKATEILGNQSGCEFKQLVLYYYIAVSFLLYAYKKVDPDIFSELGDKEYKGPVEDDVFAVYKEFSGTDSKSMSTYYYYLSTFCKDALDKILRRGEDKISYSEVYKKLYATIAGSLPQVEEIDIKLREDGWQDESVQWVFTVALQVFTYKKIYNYLKKNIYSHEGPNQNAALQHDLVYVKFMSEMLYNIFKNVLETFSDNGDNILTSRNIFFLKYLKNPKEGGSNSENIFYSAFSNLVFRPAGRDGFTQSFLDCLFPVIKRMRGEK